MRIKSYFVGSVEEAIIEARAELGEDALLLNTRRTTSLEGSAAGYEVVFGCTEDSVTGASPRSETPRTRTSAPVAGGTISPAPPAAAPAASAPPAAVPIAPAAITLCPIPAAPPTSKPEQPSVELDQLRAQMDEIHGLLLAAGRPQTMPRRVPFLDRILARLTKAGFSAALAGSIIDGVAAALPDRGECNEDELFDLLSREIRTRIKINSELGAASAGCAVIALVGPAGAGKTATLMKIAAYQAAPNRPIRLLALHGSGIGNRMELQFFARKTGVAFSAVENPESLPALVEEARQKEIVLIDTPGNQTAAERQKLGSLLARCSGVDVHLVLPGYMSSGACREAIRKYGVFWPSKLVVTKLDETTTFGTLVSEAVRAGLPLSLVVDGVGIPDSLHAASAGDLAGIAMGSEGAATAACA